MNANYTITDVSTSFDPTVRTATTKAAAMVEAQAMLAGLDKTDSNCRVKVEKAGTFVAGWEGDVYTGRFRRVTAEGAAKWSGK